MHQSAMFYGKRFFEVYCSQSKSNDFTIAEIGSLDINGSLRDVSPDGMQYIGLDFAAGKGVDVIIDDPYKFPLEDASVDAVVCSSVFEHSQFFWLVFLEVLRVLKPHGLFYLNAPNNGSFHRCPVDCWRFYPDSGLALVAWGKRMGYTPRMLESFIGAKSEDGTIDPWHDFVAVFVKDEKHESMYKERIIDTCTEYTNGYHSVLKSGLMNEQTLSPDHVALLGKIKTA